MKPPRLVTIGRVRLRSTCFGWESRARVTSGRSSTDVWYRVRGAGKPSASADPYVALSLLPAMVRGAAISVRNPVSRKMTEALPRIQEIYRSWWTDLSSTPTVVIGERRRRAVRRDRQTAVFFSAGVDSFYSLLKHIDDIDTLVFVHGFDIALGRQNLRKRVSLAIAEIARESGKRLIEVETNARVLLDREVHWELSHGAALASVAHLLEPFVSTIYVPASHSFADLFPWGSHPLLDPLWSSETVSLIHDGCEANRAERVERIAQSSTALRHLRVCWVNTKDAYNCGRCEKCLRTMLSLLAAGALGKCSTFPGVLDPAEIEKLPVKALGIVAHALENLRALDRVPESGVLREAIRIAISRYASQEHLWDSQFWSPFCFGGRYSDRIETDG